MALQELFQSVTNVALRRRSWQDMCRDLLRLKDEATVLKLAGEILERYDGFDQAERLAFFQYLLAEFRVDAQALSAAIDAYQADPNPLNVQHLNRASLPGRRKLFEILNMTPGGTHRLIALRSQLLKELRANPDLRAVDSDLEVLFSAWFNRGFLTLERIHWETPAFILEKLIKYEAVHEISGWADLQRRVSSGRRCYAFFHPALPNEPIIFVQVALTDHLAGSIDDLIREPDQSSEHPRGTMADEAKANTAIFYSISNCQDGLRGIAFGDLLIKQVVDLIQLQLPQIKTFATLSPIPGFGTWLTKASTNEPDPLRDDERHAIARLQTMDSAQLRTDPSAADEYKVTLTRLCAHYLLEQKRGAEPLDPVSRFHLRNGARLERINWLGDMSEKGLAESLGLLVNYVYDVSSVTKNHERYVYSNDIVSSSPVSQLAKRRS